jgi:CDP-diacylglycerol---glycerol-3-phosphate 3-phosphatidyltransferase
MNLEFDFLNKLPFFKVNPNDIEILKEPAEFYHYLNNEICKNSKERIIFASLYLGTGHLEEELINNIENNMKTNSKLQVKMLFDYSRGLRGERTGSPSSSSKSMVSRLNDNYPSQFNLSLYRTSSSLITSIVYKLLPERLNEVLGVMHMKIYIGDDCVVMSGANLSNDYFTNRQDRYIVIKNCAQICDLFERLIDIISQFSFKLNKRNEIELPQYTNMKQFEFKILDLLQKNEIEVPTSSSSSSSSNTFIYPLIQIPDCNIRQDETFLSQFFNEISNKKEFNSNTCLTVGYFNLTNSYIESLLTKSPNTFEILVASPQANGFFNANGLSRFIPNIYSRLEYQFLKKIKQTSNDKRIGLFEYARSKWSELSLNFMI